MTRSCAWLYSVVNELRTALKKEGYGELVIAIVLGAILVGSLGFIAVLRWEAALIFAVMSIPGGLLAGVTSVLSRHRHPEVQRPSVRKVILRFLIILAWIDANAALARSVSFVVYLIIAIPANSVIARIVRVYRRRRGTDTDK